MQILKFYYYYYYYYAIVRKQLILTNYLYNAHFFIYQIMSFFPFFHFYFCIHIYLTHLLTIPQCLNIYSSYS